MKYLLERLKEPSTHAGLAALAMLFGMPANSIQAVTGAVVAVCGAVAVLLPAEKANKAP